uniref:Secreted protein n=1 Tax=Ditylenchus dipsaci TaxID=166011 RepID=A0A915D3W7_9BILA
MWDAPLWTLTIVLLMFRLGSRKRACIPMRESSQFSHTLRCLLIVSLYLYGNFLLLDGDGRVTKKSGKKQEPVVGKKVITTIQKQNQWWGKIVLTAHLLLYTIEMEFILEGG